jgi:hypothetical protein
MKKEEENHSLMSIQVTYDYPYVSPHWVGAECFFTVAFSLDFLFRLYASPVKVWCLLHPYPFIDWMTCFPFWISWGYGNPYSYTDASGTILNAVLFFRTLRIFRSVRMMDVHKLMPLRNDRDYLRAEILRACVVLGVLFFICICCMQYTESKSAHSQCSVSFLSFRSILSLFSHPFFVTIIVCLKLCGR